VRDIVYKCLFPINYLHVRDENESTAEHRCVRFDQPRGGPALQLTCRQAYQATREPNRRTHYLVQVDQGRPVFINTNKELSAEDLESVRVIRYCEYRSPWVNPKLVPNLEEIDVAVAWEGGLQSLSSTVLQQ
jgi:hypothetical protein